jgi:flavin-dependent dehydrogenase
MHADVVVVGGGPAGIATAIACAGKGLQVTVLDSRKPPIDKPCGEGLLPEAVAALRNLGIALDSSIAFPFTGLRFSDESFSSTARITRGQAFGLRRTALHQLLVDRATKSGVSFHWGARISDFNSGGLIADGKTFSYKWLVGADGQHSAVRKWAGMGGENYRQSRFGFRRHYAVPPRTDVVEVHWGNRCQMFVTPTGKEEVCIALLSSDPHLRIDVALEQFPNVASRLRGASCVLVESGAVTALGCARSVARGNVALVGDASCTIDGIAGQGLSLAFQEAIHLGEALARADLDYYKSAHRQITRTAMRMTQLLLLMGRNNWIRRKALRLFAGNPAFYARLIAIHTGESSPEAIGMGEILNLGWRVLRA